MSLTPIVGEVHSFDLLSSPQMAYHGNDRAPPNALSFIFPHTFLQVNLELAAGLTGQVYRGHPLKAIVTLH